MRKVVYSPTLFVALAFAAGLPGWAAAQSSPSTDSIINSLKPTGNMGGLTRGIRPSGGGVSSDSGPASQPAHVAASPGPRHVAPPEVAATKPAAAPATQGARSVNLTVEFPSGSADVTPQAARSLENLGRALASSQLASFRFRIEGHTDTVGARDANQALSERRANAVVDYIVTHFGVDRSRLEPVGLGEDGLLVPTPAQTPEARNRRVLVVNISG